MPYFTLFFLVAAIAQAGAVRVVGQNPQGLFFHVTDNQVNSRDETDFITFYSADSKVLARLPLTDEKGLAIVPDATATLDRVYILVREQRRISQFLKIAAYDWQSAKHVGDFPLLDLVAFKFRLKGVEYHYADDGVFARVFVDHHGSVHAILPYVPSKLADRSTKTIWRHRVLSPEGKLEKDEFWTPTKKVPILGLPTMHAYDPKDDTLYLFHTWNDCTVAPLFFKVSNVSGSGTYQAIEPTDFPEDLDHFMHQMKERQAIQWIIDSAAGILAAEMIGSKSDETSPLSAVRGFNLATGKRLVDFPRAVVESETAPLLFPNSPYFFSQLKGATGITLWNLGGPGAIFQTTHGGGIRSHEETVAVGVILASRAKHAFEAEIPCAEQLRLIRPL